MNVGDGKNRHAEADPKERLDGLHGVMVGEDASDKRFEVKAMKQAAPFR